MTNPKIAPWQAVFRTIDESGYTAKDQAVRTLDRLRSIISDCLLYTSPFIGEDEAGDGVLRWLEDSSLARSSVAPWLHPTTRQATLGPLTTVSRPTVLLLPMRLPTVCVVLGRMIRAAERISGTTAIAIPARNVASSAQRCV